MKAAQSAGQTQVLGVVDGAGDHGNRVAVEGAAQHGQQLAKMKFQYCALLVSGPNSVLASEQRRQRLVGPFEQQHPGPRRPLQHPGQ